MNGPLPVREAYRLWAETYDYENAITALENEAVTHLTPPIAGRALLDAGCGTGRRLPTTGPQRAVGIDLVRELLTMGRSRPKPPTLVSGDIRALPLIRNSRRAETVKRKSHGFRRKRIN